MIFMNKLPNQELIIVILNAISFYMSKNILCSKKYSSAVFWSKAPTVAVEDITDEIIR